MSERNDESFEEPVPGKVSLDAAGTHFGEVNEAGHEAGNGGASLGDVTPAQSPVFNLLQHADWRAVALGALRWSPLIAAIAFGSFQAGTVAAKKLDKKSFSAETILRYQATGEESRYIDQKTVILTLKDTIKIRENIVELRGRLGMKEDPDIIGRALDIRVQKNTTLLVIAAKWPSARMAADMANGLRAIFLEKYEAKRRTDIKRQRTDLDIRLNQVRTDLRQRDRERQLFTSQNRIVDIEKQARALLEEFNNYGVLLEQAQAEKQTVEEQSRKLDSAIEDLKKRVAAESKNMASLENLSDVNTRIERIRDTIREDQEARMNQTELEMRRQEMERYKALFDKGFVAEIEYKRRAAAYEKQRILCEDTEKTARLRAERERLQKQIIPNDSGAAPSAPILAEMLLRSFEIQLDKIAVVRKVASLEQARARVKKQLDGMPSLQQQYDALQRNIATREQERKQLEDRVAARQRDLDSRLDDFTLVSEAEADTEGETRAGKSKLVAPALGGVGALLGLILVTGAQLLDNTIRSPRDATRRLSLPLLGVLPALRGTQLPFAGPEDARFRERLTVTARRLRAVAPQRGVRLLVVSSAKGEGAGTVGRNLAAALGRQGEQVVVVDARAYLRRSSKLLFADDTPVSIADLIGDTGPLLARAKNISQTTERNVSAVLRGEGAISADVLGSVRMRRLMEVLSERYDLVITIADPVLSSYEAEMLAGFTDGVVLVTRSGKARPGLVLRTTDKLHALGTPVLGTILNRATLPYLNWE